MENSESNGDPDVCIVNGEGVSDLTDKMGSLSAYYHVDVDKMIDSVLIDLCDPDKDEEAKQFEENISQLAVQVKGVEKKRREINKILLDCTDELNRFKETLELSEREEEQAYNQAAMEALSAAKAQKIQDEKSDSDDEVQFIEATFDPTLVKRRITPASASQPPVSSSPTKPAPPSLSKETIVVQQTQKERPTLDVLRKALAATINKQFVPPGSADQSQSGSPQQKSEQMSTSEAVTELTAKANQAYFEEFQNIGPGSPVMAKKANEIWHKATVIEVNNPNQPFGDRKLKVRFDNKTTKVLSVKLIAFGSSIVRPVTVGSRVAALYKEEEEDKPSTSYYAGIVAEAPNGRNNHRYLIFFEDGYAQYCLSTEIHKIIYQSDKVWEDIPQDSKEFIKEYLKQYPERPMVRLNRGQTIKTEWNGRWWSARVIEVDASLSKMFFAADKRVEWIYRGSTRLEPLYTALASAEANKITGKLKRHNLKIQSKKAVVEYTRGVDDKQKATMNANANTNANTNTNNNAVLVEDGTAQKVGWICWFCGKECSSRQPLLMHLHWKHDMSKEDAAEAIVAHSLPDQKKRPVARKSTGGAAKADTSWEAPWLKIKRKTAVQVQREHAQEEPAMPPEMLPEESNNTFQASSISSNKTAKDMASVLQTRLATAEEGDIDEENLGERVDNVVSIKESIRKKIIPHECSPFCLRDAEECPSKFKGQNPLLLPMLCGWERHVCKMKPSGKRTVLYRTPCGRRLRCIEETARFLILTDSNLTIDYFCFDPYLHTHTEFVPVKTFCDIKDLSYGKENVAISCVNGIDRQYPDYVEYSNQRIPAKGVLLNLDTDFLCGCDCTDYCQTNCACQQRTVEATTWGNTTNKADAKAGYSHRRLEEPVLTGVFECNSKCSCNSKCHNRVAQNGLQVRLQVFKTEKRGWGLRCLNDIPCGGFICIYAGQLLTEQGANEDGQQYGDEYLAELDYMEVVEAHKEGYESDCDSDEGVGDSEEESDDNRSVNSDSTFSADDVVRDAAGVEMRTHGTRTRTKKKGSGQGDDSSMGKLVLHRESKPGTKVEGWSIKIHSTTSMAKTAGWVESLASDPIIICDDDEEEEEDNKKGVVDASNDLKKGPNMEIDDELPDLDPAPDIEQETSVEPVDVKNIPLLSPPTRARRSGTTKMSSRFKNLPDPKRQEGMEIKEDKSTIKEEKSGSRHFFGGEECIYIMDAKSMGNIGRYLNHSCSPNVFVQNVFVDTHDLRFPWVAFFAGQFIRAGTELTWDYNYEVGSVPNKILYCYCGSADCRGRLL